MGDVAAAIVRRQAAIDDAGCSLDARHYCNVLALYLTCSSGAAHLRRPEWIDVVTALVERSDVAVNRLVGRVASRLLITRAPELAAARLREVLSADDREPGMTDSIALVTAAGLLASAHHPVADDVVATLALRSATAYLGNLVPDMASRRARGRVLGYDLLVARLLDALADLAARASSRPAPSAQGDG